MSFFGYKLGSGSEKGSGAGREARKSMEVGLAGLYLFLPAPPCPSKAGRKISLSYTMTYEGFLPASPASPILITLIFISYLPTYLPLLFLYKDQLNCSEQGGQGGSLHNSLIESGLFSSLLLKGKVGREEGGGQ